MQKKITIWIILVALMISAFPADTFAAPNPVKNVIIVMPDGMGATHAAATRWYQNGQRLAADEMISGAIRTYSAESLISDSAPASTAFATGHKSNSKFIGVLPVKTTIPGVSSIAADQQYKPVASVLEGAKLVGKSTGLIATSNIQHASPAGYSAHNSNRGDYNDIAEQQVYLNIDVVFGGGKQYLLPVEQGGKRKDGENLLEVLKGRGYQFIETRDELMNLKNKKTWGLFAMDDMAYEFDRPTLRPQEPSLAEMTKKAIELLSQNPKGFFLFVESSKVDWASHANDPIGVISDTLSFDAAVKVALDFAKKDGQTLVLAFTDHGNGGMSIGNQSTDKNYDTLPFEALVAPLKKATLTGEGVEKTLAGNLSASNIHYVMSTYYGIEDLSSEEITAIQKAKKGSLNYIVGPMISKRSSLGWTTTGHTGEDVFLYAFGPNKPTGLIENTDLAHAQAKALGFELNVIDKKLFVEANQAFSSLGAKVSLDKADPTNAVLIVEKGMKRAELPISKNIIKMNGKSYEMNGLTILSAKTGKVYVSQQAVEIVTTGLQ
ncbi:MAG: alkaline phosphatase [Negativicutes bacterium]